MSVTYTLCYSIDEATRKADVKAGGDGSQERSFLLHHGGYRYDEIVELVGLLNTTYRVDAPYRDDGYEFDHMPTLEEVVDFAIAAPVEAAKKKVAFNLNYHDNILFSSVPDYRFRDSLKLLREVGDPLVAEYDHRKEAYDAAKEAKLRADIDSALAQGVSYYLNGSGREWSVTTYNRIDPSQDESLRKLFEEAEQEAKALNAELARTAREKDAKRRAERQSWIDLHGSERLKRCVAEEIDCDGIYLNERLAMERPNWRWEHKTPGEDSDPSNPTTKAFELLDEARQTDPDAELRYWSIERDEDEFDDDQDKYLWRGYVAMGTFLGLVIVYGVPAELKVC